MSYDERIGLGKEKEGVVTLTAQEYDWINRMGVTPILHNLKDLLPKKDGKPEPKEPEPKAFVPRGSSFNNIRSFFKCGANSFLVPGQLYTASTPLVNVLVDTKRRGSIPTCELSDNGYSLRWRGNIDPRTGEYSRRDFNEKSAGFKSQVIGGCIDRDEREGEYGPDVSDKEGYNKFLQKYRDLNDPAFSDKIPYKNLHVYAGYITARTMYAFAVKHPQHDFMLICEACEDRTRTLRQDMFSITSEYQEFEFEPKQAIGTIPHFAQSPERFKLFLYSFMRDIQESLVQRIPGAMLNIKSKADMAREHLMDDLDFQRKDLQQMGLTKYYNAIKKRGDSETAIAVRAALFLGTSLDETLKDSVKSIQDISAKLYREKMVEKSFHKPDDSFVGTGTYTIAANNNIVFSPKHTVSPPKIL